MKRIGGYYNMKNRNLLIYKMAFTAFFIALIIVMSFTDIGYIRLPLPAPLTLLVLPVTIGAILMGPICGMVLGFTFGCTSFALCFMGDPIGTLMIAQNVFLTIVVCIVTRTLMGLLIGLIFKGLKKAFHKILTNPEVSNGKKKSINIFIHAVSCFSATFINTLLFTSLLLLCFYNIIEEKAAEAGAQVMIFVFANFVGINWILETIVNLLAGTVITSSLENLVNRKFNLLKQ